MQHVAQPSVVKSSFFSAEGSSTAGDVIDNPQRRTDKQPSPQGGF